MKPNLVKIGEIYNNRIVIEEVEPKFYGKRKTFTRQWLFECCNCGTKIKATCGDIKRNSSCKTCKGLPKGYSGFKKLYSSYQSNAKSRNIDFLLSEEEFKSLAQSPCHYCGRISSIVCIGNKPTIFWTSFVCNGVDRIDNSKCYSVNNCVTCCKICNHAKCDMSYKEFDKYLDHVTEFRGSQNAQFGENVQFYWNYTI